MSKFPPLTKEKAIAIFGKVHEEKFKIQCEVLEGGTLPSKKFQTDAGFDVYATEDITLIPGAIYKHPLNIRFKLPGDTWGEITTKSGLGAKGQLVFAGVIDETYRGIPHVIMTNLNRGTGPYGVGAENIVIKKGEKIAQFIMSPHSSQYYIEQVDKVETDTARGEGGFGSTGK